MNLQQQEQFYQMITRLRPNSRTASLPEAETRITEVNNGIIVTRPLKKIEYISEHSKTSEPEAESQVWNLT